MPWLCNGCGLTQAQGLAELSRMVENESSVSYDQYFVTSTGTFYCNCPDNTVSTARALGLNVYPIITSGDEAGADDLALLQHENWWAPFIQTAMSTATADGYAGYNFDFEGTGSGTAPANTSADYAHFLWDFSNASHALGLKVSMDVAWFAPQLWDPAYLSATPVDVFYDMDYYNWTYFWNRLDLDLANYPLDRLGEGLAGDVGNGNTCPGDVGIGGFAQRIHILESYNITRTAFWAMADYAIGNGCWDYPPLAGALLHDFLYNGSVSANWTDSMGGAPDGWAFCPGGWSASGNPPVTGCASTDLTGTNVTLYTANVTGNVSQINLQGNETITRIWSSSLDDMTLNLWEYLDSANVTLFEQNLSCSTGGVVSTSTLPTGTGWLHRSVDLAFAPGQVCGLRLGISTASPGRTTGLNDWFANIGIVMGSSLKATAVASPLTGTVPLSVHFSSTVSGGTAPYGYSWAFGDGASSASSDPSHTFNASGTFHVVLTVTDSLGLVNRAYANVTVSALPLVADVSASPLSGDAPLAVQFAASVSGGTPPYSYLWAFGDGARSAAATPSHVYNSTGVFEAVLTVTDSARIVTHAYTNVTVSAGKPLAVTVTGSPAAGLVDLKVSFTATATGGTGVYSSWLWSFGDGDTANTQNATHLYTSAGSFTARVEVWDGLGDTANSTAFGILVYTPLISVLTVSNDSLLLGWSTTFSAQVTGGTRPYAFSWHDLPPGCTPADQANITCEPTATGGYTVSVLITDSSIPPQSSNASATIAVGSSCTSTCPISSWDATGFLLLVLLVVAAAVVISLIAVRRARRKSTGEPPAPPVA
jgi:PKD repeat protein